MKTFEIEIGGKVRRLSFHTLDAIALKKRFGRGARELVFRGVLGIEPVGADGKTKADPFLMDQEVQIAVLYLALRRGGSQIPESQLVEWIDAHQKEGKEFGDLVVPAAKAALYSGAITGTRVDLDENPDEEPAEGKAEAAPEGEA